jgi:hypothetical protein
MFGGMREQRSAACVSDLRFDAWLAGELSAPDEASMSAHVASCARCRERQEGLVDARARFEMSAAASVPAFLRPERKRTRLPRWAAGLSALALAAALLLVLLPQRESRGVRVKGSDQVSFFVKRGDTVQRGAREQRVRPGDKLRFTYTATSPRYLAILSVDAANEVSVYYPPGEHAARIAPGVEVALPNAVELDGVLGQERVFALFCETDQALAALSAQLRRAPQAFQAPPSCSLDSLLLTKEAPAP